MLTRVFTAALLGATSLVPAGLPILVSALVLLALASLSIVCWSLLRGADTRARLRVGRWFDFSLDARDGARRNRRKK